MNKIFNFMRSKVFGKVFKKCCENLSRWTWKPKVRNFVHLILKTRDYEDSASIFRFFVSHHKKKGRNFKKITPEFGRIMQNWILKPLWLANCNIYFWYFLHKVKILTPTWHKRPACLVIWIGFVFTDTRAHFLSEIDEIWCDASSLQK